MSPTVLVGVDLSEACNEVLAHAAEQARWRGAHLELVLVYPPPETAAAFPVPPGKGSDRPDHEGARQRALERLDEWLDDCGVDVSDLEIEKTLVPGKRPGKELVARSEHADLVVVGARRRTGISAPVLGSVSEQVVRRCTVPVLLVRAKPKRRRR